MKINIKNIDKKLIVIAIALIFIIIVFIISLFLKPKEPKLSEPIVPPITFTDGRTVFYEDTVPYLGSIATEIKIYRISTDGVISRINSFVDKLPVDLPSKAVGTSTILWGDYSSDFITYDELTGEISFYFEKYQLRLTDFTSSSGTDIELFKDILDKLNPNAKYVAPETTDSFGNTRLSSSRLLDGIAIEQGAIMPRTDFIELTPAGVIIRGKIVVLDFIPEVTLDRIEIKQVGDLIDSGDAGIEYQELLPPELTYYDSDETHGGDGEYVEDLPVSDNINTDYKTSQCRARSTTLIYYLRSVGQNYLYPAYKVDCLAQAEKNGKLIDVPVIVFVNAVEMGSLQAPAE